MLNASAISVTASFIVRRNATRQGHRGDGPVHDAGVEIEIAKMLGQKTADGALARSGRAVNCDRAGRQCGRFPFVLFFCREGFLVRASFAVVGGLTQRRAPRPPSGPAMLRTEFAKGQRAKTDADHPQRRMTEKLTPCAAPVACDLRAR